MNSINSVNNNNQIGNNSNNNSNNEIPNILKSSFGNLPSNIKNKSKVFEHNESIDEYNPKRTNNLIRTSQTLKDKTSVLNSPSPTSNYNYKGIKA